MANLITLQDYKTAQGITQPKDDARLNVLIPSVSQLIKTYCGNSIVGLGEGVLIVLGTTCSLCVATTRTMIVGLLVHVHLASIVVSN